MKVELIYEREVPESGKEDMEYFFVILGENIGAKLISWRKK